MLEGEVAGALVDLQHARDGFRILLSERLAHVQDAVGVEVGVAEEQPRARLQLGLRHVRVETCRSEEHTSELPSLMRIPSAVFCLQTKHTPVKPKSIDCNLRHVEHRHRYTT